MADKVDICLSIEGKCVLTGTAAHKKAQEIVQLVDALEQFGIKEKDFFLDSVQTKSEKGVLGQTTIAEYRVRIRCNDLNILKDILGVVTTQKNTKLDALKWGFTRDEGLRNELLEACVRDSKQQASRIASTLGVTLIGVYSFLSEFSQYDTDRFDGPRIELTNRLVGARARPEPLELGFALTHREWLEVVVNAEYRISEFAKK